MEQSDIKELIKLLKESHKLEDWAIVEEAVEYLSDFLDDESGEEEE